MENPFFLFLLQGSVCGVRGQIWLCLWREGNSAGGCLQHDEANLGYVCGVMEKFCWWRLQHDEDSLGYVCGVMGKFCRMAFAA